MSYLISVVLPVYNCEKYLRESLDSIVNQTLGIENIEVIIVDDASTDNTFEIAKEYESKYPSIKAIQHEYNKGCGPGRNTGLEYVTTDYVTYLDGDDMVSSNAYERALEIFNEDEEVDLVLFRWEEFDDKGLWNRKDRCKELLKEDKVITNIKEYPEIIFASYAYIKVYPRKLFKYLDFPPGTYQDNIVSCRVMINAEKIFVAGDICVYYRQRSDSSSRDLSNQNDFNLLNSAKMVIDLRDENPQYYDILSFLALKSTYWPIYHLGHSYCFTIDENKAVFERLQEYPLYFSHEIFEKYREQLPNYLQASEQALWDLNEMDYYEYVLKYCFLKENDNLKQDINSKKQKISKLNKELKSKNKEIKKLKKENLKKDKKINAMLNSNSWKITKPLRKIKRNIKK